MKKRPQKRSLFILLPNKPGGDELHAAVQAMIQKLGIVPGHKGVGLVMGMEQDDVVTALLQQRRALGRVSVVDALIHGFGSEGLVVVHHVFREIEGPEGIHILG